MVQRKRIVTWALILIALAIALAVRGRFQFSTSIPFFASDKALLSYRPLLFAAAAAFVVLGLYWNRASKNASAVKSSESRASRAFHVFLTNLAFLLEFLPIHGLGRFLPVSPPIMAVGLAVEVAGLFLAIWSREHLGTNWSGEITIKVDHQLIRSGPYRLLRHPIYTGLLLMYVGIALVTGEKLAIIGLLIIVFAYWRKIRLEETNLEVAFGADYSTYRRETWALVPGLF